jgi:hypothetical protein
MIMKARKDYTRPTMKVVQLRHAGMLMTSPAQAGVQNYTWTTEIEE